MENSPPGVAGKSSTGLDDNIAALLTYIFGWVSGLIFFLIEKDSKLVRFHAMQSILFGIVWSVLMVVLVFIGMIFTFIGAAATAAAGDAAGTLFGLIISLVWLLVWLVPLALFVGLILTAVKAYQGQMFKLPIIGNMAEKIVNK